MKFHVDARFVEGKDPAPEMAAELARVNELRAAGVIEQLIRRTDDTGAFLIMEAPDAAALEEALESLPFARSSTMTFVVDVVEIL
ncbi:muconolactone Delta-isomerase family protein [Nocardia alni]|uniref:muconolactone Delta-isomerase family protein n=1 Tax=Nocardia alni TaxID=2815723 RepID=UPI001C23ECBC|nr:muconolactone Delta-isomerase family protein [Nocardia alni]